MDSKRTFLSSVKTSNDIRHINEDKFTRRTFLLCQYTNKKLIASIARREEQLNQLISFSFFMRLIINEHIFLPEDIRLAGYREFHSQRNVIFQGKKRNINRTFTLTQSQLRTIEQFAARNKYDGIEPASVNLLLFYLVNKHLNITCTSGCCS